jgi:HK97 family phage prohead protease
MNIEKPTGREVRVAVDTWPMADMEIRAEGDGLTFRGYAAVFDSPSEPLPFVERIRPGAFARSLKRERSIKMFHNHNSDIVLGSTRAKTLTLIEDQRGLLAEATLPDNYWGHYVRDAVKRGDIDSMSFGFQTVKDSWSGDMAERDLIEARLFEVSDVSGWPAYAATSASVRELAEIVDEDPDELAEAFKLLREPEARLSTSQASLLTKLINARSDRPVRRVLNDEEQAIYAAFEAALS